MRRTTANGGRTDAAARWLVLVVMCVGYFLVLLDVTIVNVALPQIGDGLGTGVSGLQWVVDGYALALTALLLAGGTIGDLAGATSRAGHFVAGLHTAVVITAALFLAAAVATITRHLQCTGHRSRTA